MAVRRISVNLSKEAQRKLEALKDELGETITQVIGRALDSLYDEKIKDVK